MTWRRKFLLSLRSVCRNPQRLLRCEKVVNLFQHIRGVLVEAGVMPETRDAFAGWVRSIEPISISPARVFKFSRSAALESSPRREPLVSTHVPLSPRGTSGERDGERGSQVKAPPLPGPLLLPASGGEGEEPMKPGVPDLCRYQWREPWAAL